MKNNAVARFQQRRLWACLCISSTLSAWAGSGLHPTALDSLLAVGPPVITRVTPNSGVIGEHVTMFGNNLEGTTEVKFNGVSAPFEINTGVGVMIITTVPPAATTGPITLTTAQGTFTTADPFVIHDGKPVIESFSPKSASPGTTVHISGTNLKYISSVRFNGVEAKFGLGFDNATLLATVPADATSGPISVSGPQGSFTSEESFTFEVPPALVVEEWPTAAQVGAPLIVRVTGTELFFGVITDVKINGESMDFITMVNDLRIAVSTNATSGPITIVTRRETITSPSPLIIYPKPLVTGLHPQMGPPGTVVQLQGTDLGNITGVWLGGTRLPYSRDTLSFTILPGTSNGILYVSTPVAKTGTILQFEVTPSPYPTGLIITRSGTIAGPIPNSKPALVGGAVSPASTPSSPQTNNDFRAVASAASSASTSAGAGEWLHLSWPDEARDCILETTANLAAGSWTPVPGVPILNNGQMILEIPQQAGARFFRLKYPGRY